MSLRLKFAEIQAASAEREAAKLQNELEIILDDVDDWKAKYQEICEELEHTFYEMSDYWFVYIVQHNKMWRKLQRIKKSLLWVVRIVLIHLYEKNR